MSVINAAGQNYTSVTAYRREQICFRIVNGMQQSPFNFLSRCYLYMTEIFRGHISVIFKWAKRFTEKTAVQPVGRRKILSLMDSYAAYVRKCPLKLLRDTGIVLISLPAHKSYVIQPLDVSVFGLFKSNLQTLIYNTVRVGSFLEALDLAAKDFRRLLYGIKIAAP